MPLPKLGAEAAIAKLPAWTKADGARDAIARTFKFKEFNAAFGFMTRVALWADKHDHHPEWSNIYNTVEVTLTTHDADGVTQNDIDLAAFMDAAFVDAGAGAV